MLRNKRRKLYLIAKSYRIVVLAWQYKEWRAPLIMWRDLWMDTFHRDWRFPIDYDRWQPSA